MELPGGLRMPSEIVTDAIDLRRLGGNGADGLPPGHDGSGEGSFRSGAVPQRTYVTGMLVALGGILMFFAALVSALVVRKGLSAVAWQAVEVPRILWLNTLILLGSSFTLSRSRRDFLAQDQAGFRHWWGVTTILGVFFLTGQIIAWRQLVAAGIYLKTNPSSSFFYVFTAAHGLPRGSFLYWRSRPCCSHSWGTSTLCQRGPTGNCHTFTWCIWQGDYSGLPLPAATDTRHPPRPRGRLRARA